MFANKVKLMPSVLLAHGAICRPT